MTAIFKKELDINLNDITNKVLSLRDLWISRSKDFPFYTLGRCAYLDGKTEAYYHDSSWQNDILIGEFYELYEAVLTCLSHELEEPVELAHDLSIPGFHVFPSDPRLLAITGDWHMDFPHDTLNIGRADPSAFTLAIKLPTSGGGMDWIDDQGTIKHLPYKEGELVMHSGLGLHRIAGIKKYVPDEYRITLQGHLIRRNNIMEMFW